jgi:hypothetical protein
MNTTYIITRPGEAPSDPVQLPEDFPEKPDHARLSAILDPVFPRPNHWEHFFGLNEAGEVICGFCDERSQIKQLPLNEQGTEIYRRLAKRNFPKAVDDDLPFIAGPVVIFSRRVWF